MNVGSFRVQHHRLLDSTNNEAKRLAEQGCAHATTVWADEQTAGRGRYGRSWQSVPGNLLVSVVLRPAVPAARASELGFVAAVTTSACVGALLGCDDGIELKWPNDVRINGGKVAGVLPEAQANDDNLDWVVIGVGLNLMHAPTHTPYPSTSLRAHGAFVSPEQALEVFLEQLEHWLGRWGAEGFAAVREAWLARAPGVGSPITVQIGDRRESGLFRGLDTDGALILGTDAGPRRITAGDVAFA